MQFRTQLQIGKRSIEITGEVQTNTDFVKQMAFLDSLPEVGPSGGTNLIFTHRTPKNNSGQRLDYYSIKDMDTGEEFMFGIHQDEEKSLFAKKWVPAYRGESAELEDESQLDPANVVSQNDQQYNVPPTQPRPSVSRPPFVSRPQTPLQNNSANQGQQRGPQTSPPAAPASGTPSPENQRNVNSVMNKYRTKP